MSSLHSVSRGGILAILVGSAFLSGCKPDDK